MFLQKIFSEDVIFFLFCSPSVHYECYTSCKLWPLVTPLCSASSLEAVLYHNHSVKKFTGVYVLCNHNGDECVVFLMYVTEISCPSTLLHGGLVLVLVPIGCKHNGIFLDCF